MKLSHENTKYQTQEEAKASQIILQRHSVQDTIFKRCYLQEL